MGVAIYLALILVSVALIVVVLMQGKGGGFGGGIFGADTMYTSRRGVERTVYRLTIILVITFIVLDLLAVIYSR